MARRIRLFVLMLTLLGAPSVPAQPVDLEAQRQLFVTAYRDLEAGKPVDLARLDAQLEGYLLRPYLTHLALRGSLETASAEQIAEHLEAHRNLPVTGQLRRAWLDLLAKNERWEEFRRFDDGADSVHLRCYRLQAAQAAEAIDGDWITEARALWMSGRSQPKACDTVFAELYQRDLISSDEVWRRVRLAMGRNQPGLARSLAPRLDPEHQGWLRHWLRVHDDPRAALAKPRFALADPRARILINHGIKRLAPRAPEEAMELVARFEQQRAFGAGEAAILRRHVALQAAYSRDPRALAWFEGLPAAMQDEDVRLWQARLTLGQQDWSRLLEIIELMAVEHRRQNEWRYWRAHALQATGQEAAAQAAFAALATQRNYYGFLAADRIGRPYSFNHSPVEVAEADLARLLERPGVVRAREFYELGMLSEARREWHTAVGRLSAQEQAAAAVLAARWQWFDRAIVAANRAGLMDSLDLRFPLAFRDQVEHYSRAHQLDPTLTLAVLRKESAFRPDAVSAVGALGLMQVMPATAREVAELLQEAPPTPESLLDIETNLKLGSAYLRQVLDRFGDNPVLAAAAYNAGPHRVDTWLARHPDVPTAIWIENISFAETRDYVKSILAFSTVFDAQMNSEPRRLSDRLKPISAP